MLTGTLLIFNVVTTKCYVDCNLFLVTPWLPPKYINNHIYLFYLLVWFGLLIKNVNTFKHKIKNKFLKDLQKKEEDLFIYY